MDKNAASQPGKRAWCITQEMPLGLDCKCLPLCLCLHGRNLGLCLAAWEVLGNASSAQLLHGNHSALCGRGTKFCSTPSTPATQCHPECKAMDYMVPTHTGEYQRPIIQTPSRPGLLTQGAKPGSSQVFSLELFESTICCFLNISAWLPWNTSRPYYILEMSYMSTVIHKNEWVNLSTCS